MSEDKSKKRTAEQLAKFGEGHGLALSERFCRFWRDEVDDHKGKRVGGVPSYTRDTQLKVSFKKPSFELFEENEVERDENPTLVPFATLGEESQFLAIDVVDPAGPVFMWEHETGCFEKGWPSLDAFLAALVTKGTVSPIKRLEKAREKANALNDEGKNEEALALLEPVLKEFPIGEKEPMDGHQGDIGDSWSLLGVIYKDLGRNEEAIAAYKNGMACESEYAALNLLQLLENLGRAEEERDVAAKLKEETYWFQEYPWFWSRRYLAAAYLLLGDEAKADAELRPVHERWFKSAEKIGELQKELEEVATKHPATKGAVAKLLEWVKPKSYVLPPEENAANRRWWDALPEGAKEALREEAKLEEGDDDVTIARLCDVESIDVGKDTKIADVAIFGHLRELRRLKFHGDPDTLEPLRALPKLERVTLNGKVIRDLRLPPKQNRALFAAVKKGDRAAIAAAIAGGADITAKNDGGNGVLFIAYAPDVFADEDEDGDEEEGEELEGDAKRALLEHLVDLGADVYANHDDEGTIESYVGEEDFRALEARYLARGGKKPESPFRVLEEGHESKSASFGDLAGLPEGVDIDHEEPIAIEKIPPGVYFGMRSDYSGYKKDTQVRDYHESHPSGTAIVSARLKDLLVAQGAADAQFIPVGLRNHKGEPLPEAAWILHPRVVDCLDHLKSEPEYNHIDPDSVSEVKRLVLDETKIPAETVVFRVKGLNSHPILVRRSVADAIEQAGVSHVSFHLPKR